MLIPVTEVGKVMPSKERSADRRLLSKRLAGGVGPRQAGGNILRRDSETPIGRQTETGYAKPRI